MNNFLRTIIAGWGAKKLGGGCLSTIVVFILIYYALGNCNSHPAATAPQRNSLIVKPTLKTASAINSHKTFSLAIR